MQITPEDWKTVSKLFDDVLDLPDDARQRWLDTLPSQYAAYRDTLQSLLASHAKIQTSDFLNTLTGVEAPQATTVESSLTPGAIVGGYVIEEQIGRGGMGTVWRAHRADGAIKRSVALKLPNAALFADGMAQRFVLERDILAQLSHPNIAHLYDAGTTENAQPFLALEYVQGLSLTEYCNTKQLDIRQRLQLVLQMLEAVRYAHSHLVIHRDLKPTNILVTPEGQLRLLDFGIAKLLPSHAARSAMTELGVRALTPDYAAPELISNGSVTTATDVYSAGVVIYELLTGERPYRLQRNSLAALEEAILSEDRIRPSRAVISEQHAACCQSTATRLQRQLIGDLDTIVLKALKSKPEERYATVDALYQDIERYLSDRPVLAQPDSRWYVFKKFIVRHSVPLAISTSVLIALLTVTTLAIVEAQRADHERDLALHAANRSETVSEFLKTLITEAAQSDEPVTVNDMLSRSEHLANTEYAADPESRAAILDLLGTYYQTTADFPKAKSLLKTAENIANQSPDWVLRAQITCDELDAGDSDEKDTSAAITMLAIISDKRTPDRQAVDCLSDVANIASNANRANDAVRYRLDALARYEKLPRRPAVMGAELLASLATDEQLNGRTDLADLYFGQALEKLVSSGRGGSADAIAIRNNWAVMQSSAGDPRHAVELYDQILAITSAQKTFTAGRLTMLSNRANALAQSGRNQDSIRVAEECISHASGNQQATCLFVLSGDYRDLGNIAQARVYTDKAAHLVEGNISPQSWMTYVLATARGALAVKERHFAEARLELDKVITARKSNSQGQYALILRAEANMEDGRLLQAEQDARDAIALGQKLQGHRPYSNRTGLAWFTLARILQKQDKRDDAVAALRTAVLNLENTVDSTHPALQQAKQLLQ